MKVKFLASSVSPTYQAGAVTNGCLCLKGWSLNPESNLISYLFQIYSSETACDNSVDSIRIKIADGSEFMSSFSLVLTDAELTNGLSLADVKSKVITYLGGATVLNTLITAV